MDSQQINGAFTLLSSLATILLAGAVLYLAPRRLENRVFAFTIAGLGASRIPPGLGNFGLIPNDAVLPPLLVVLLLTLTIGGLAYFLCIFPRARGPGRLRQGFAAIVAASTTLGVLLLLYETQGGGRDLAISLFLLESGLAAAILARDARSSPDHRSTALLLVAGFASYTSARGAHRFGLVLADPAQAADPLIGLEAAAFVLAVAAALVARSRLVAVVVGLLGAIGLASSFAADPWGRSLFDLNVGAARLLLPVLVAYAIARLQLFGLEFKVKAGIRRSTLVGFFVVCFIAVAEVASNYVADTVGFLAAAVATALLLFATQPLQRIAARVAERSMPMVQDTPTYHAYRRMEIYRAALESASKGGITASERRMLEALREKLGLSAQDVRPLEAQVHPRAEAVSP